MEKRKTVTRKTADIVQRYFVRIVLDEDNISKLMELYTNNVEVAPIEITSDNILIDGRHRLKALEKLKKTEVQCVIIPEKDPAHVIAHALNSNEGGSQPMSKDDIVHAILLMLQHKASERQIYSLINYPQDMVRKYLEKAKHNLTRQKLVQAKQAVAEYGYSVKEAAQEFDINLERLKREIAGPKANSDSSSLASINTITSHKAYAMHRHNQAVAKRLIQGLADETTEEAVVFGFLKHVDALLNRQLQALEDWNTRAQAAKAGRMVSWNKIESKEEGEKRL